MPSAELNIKTTHDGTQAERSIDRLQTNIEKFGSTVSGKISRAMSGLFALDRILTFNRALEKTIADVGSMVDKLKEGKATVEEITKGSQLAPPNVGSLAGMSSVDKRNRSVWENMKALTARAWYGLGGAFVSENITGSQEGMAKAAHALFGELGTLGVAEMQGRLKTQKATREERRQQAIKELIDREYGPAEGRNVFTEMAPITGRYFGPGVPDYRTQQNQRSVEIEQRQLETLNRIMRILDQGPSSGGGTAFPR